MKEHGNYERSSKFDYSDHTSHITAEVKLPLFANRRYTGVQIWGKGNNETYFIAGLGDKLTDVTINEEATIRGVVPGTTTQFMILEKVAPRVSIITLIQEINLNITGGAGSIISHYGAKFTMNFLDTLLYKYQRREKLIDKEIRDVFVNNIPFAPPILGTHLHLVEECKQLAFDYDSADGLLETKFKKTSFSSEIGMQRKEKRSCCERTISTGRCIDVIDETPEKVLSWLYCFCSAERMTIHKNEGNIARFSLTDDGRQHLVATIKHMPWLLYNREFIFRMIWWKEGGVYYLATASVDDVVDYG